MEVDGDSDGLGLEIRVFVQRENVRVEWVCGYSMSKFSKTYREVSIFQNSISNVGILPNFSNIIFYLDMFYVKKILIYAEFLI